MIILSLWRKKLLFFHLFTAVYNYITYLICFVWLFKKLFYLIMPWNKLKYIFLYITYYTYFGFLFITFFSFSGDQPRRLVRYYVLRTRCSFFLGLGLFCPSYSCKYIFINSLLWLKFWTKHIFLEYCKWKNPLIVFSLNFIYCLKYMKKSGKNNCLMINIKLCSYIFLNLYFIYMHKVQS